MKRLFRLGGRDRIQREVEEEVRFHLEKKIEALEAGGLSRAEAEEEARRRFGDVEVVKGRMEATQRRREARMGVERWWEGWRQDIGYALRQLRRAPGFAGVVIFTLALGIGMNTAIFSVVDGILFRPLPFPESEQLVNVWSDVTRRGGPDDEWLSYANFHDLREETASLEALAAWGGWAPVWLDPQEPEQLLGARITEGMLSRVLRVEPLMGRWFRAADDRPDAPPVVVISHAFWEEALGRDPDAVGRQLRLDAGTFQVMGVMPAAFQPPFLPDARLWAPARLDPDDMQNRRGGFSWRAVGRVAEGVPVASAAAEVGEMGRRLEARYPESNTDMSFRAVPLQSDLVSEARSGLLVLLGAVGFVLLVACVNVANLLLARATRRESELAVRSSLGAGRARIARQLLTESLVLAFLGGASGVALAFGATELLVTLAPDGTPRLGDVGVDGRVLAFTAAITLLSGVAFGLVPAVRVARSDLHGALQQGGRGGIGGRGARLRRALVTGQVALALVLLVGAGLLVRSFQNLRTTDLGFRPDDVLTLRVNLPSSRYPTDQERLTFTTRLEERLAAVPGVTSVGATGTLPLTGFDGDASFHVEGRPLPGPGQGDAAWIRVVTPGYMETMGMEVVTGRGFDPDDRAEGKPVLIINETLAASHFPGENPVGRRITFSDPTSPDAVWREIVGVVGDIRNFGIREDSRFAAYAPWAQIPQGAIFPVLRTAVPPSSVISSVRGIVRELDPGLATAQVRTMEEIVGAAVAPDRFVTVLLSLFALLAVTLSVVGLYGVVSWEVGSRMRELGLRMALGAGSGRISRMVVGRTLVLVGIGIVLGLAGALLLTRIMGSLLFEVGATDPATFAGVTVALLAAASSAAFLPALRASRVEPTEALRAE